jgi:type III restriction enzyme
MSQQLHEILDAALKINGPDFYKNQVPEYVYSNLREKFSSRPYQQEAFGRFNFFWKNYHARPKGAPTQLLYHMATGSGKTLVMAGLIIYLYGQGYRNFLFFVNSVNIIEKTRNNFLKATSSKYLFADSISIFEKQVRIREVDSFQAANQDDINIAFSTTQGLHSRLNTPKENSITYDDFEETKIVLISDEAHHINTETKNAKNLGKSELLDLMSWESTINNIFNANQDNVLLEFTATIDLTNDRIIEKYHDKIIFDYPLKSFRLDGYSKEVKVLQSEVRIFDRALQAVLLSQFRRKVFGEHKQIIKPVILFKSKTIEESSNFFDDFVSKIKSLKAEHLRLIKDNQNLDDVLVRMFNYFEDNNITLENLALELREDFSENKCIVVNSKDESEQKQIAVNTLEDYSNEYRAIFAVDKLNEGWDVLNLFDIVRLYNTRDAKSGKPGKTTLSEAQLMGRGARYCPFRITEEQPLYQRKYDTLNDEKERDLKLCEELYYHSAHNPKYIQELHVALQEIGIKANASRELTLALKPEFKTKTFYKSGFIFKNQRVKYERDDIVGINTSFIQTLHLFSLLSGASQSAKIFGFNPKILSKKIQKDFFIKSFESHVIRKALNQFPEYKFNNLTKLFPNLKSMSEFIQSDNYLGKIQVEVEGLSEDVNNLSQKNKLYIVIKLLDKLSGQLQLENVNYKGTKEFTPFMVKDIFTDKILNIVNDGTTDQEFGLAQSETSNQALSMNLADKDWFVFNENYGTSEEKYLVKYIAKVVDQLNKEYSEVYLLRNEKHFQLFNFDDGQAFEPDFVLFLIKDSKTPAIHYQVFIEPKGGHLLKKDEWKSNFLLQLEAEYKIENLWNDKEYVVWGMPLYNEVETKVEFNKAFERLL